MTNVAIVVPQYRPYLTPDEEISWQHLWRYLGENEIFLLTPQSLILNEGRATQQPFPDHYFRSVDDYSRLLLRSEFYERFITYEFILIYQLDSLVFSSELLTWCRAGYDYIGAPWFVEKNNPVSGLSRVGNGGLSLRRVESFLNVLNSRRYLDGQVSLWKEFVFTDLKDVRHSERGAARLRKKSRVLRAVRAGVRDYVREYKINEDHFWSDRAKLFYPGFKIAPPGQALQFAFETAPRACFELNDKQLPFGCHAWAKWDRAFWEPHLLPGLQI